MLRAASSNSTSPDILHVYMYLYIRKNADEVCDWGDVGYKGCLGVLVSGILSNLSFLAINPFSTRKSLVSVRH